MRNLLVANRGEIARRVFRTCAELGIARAAVFSDADADSPHVAEADTAVRLPGEAPADTYLRADLLVAAAKATGADAVHPGYGFLSENAGFAQAVLDAGLTWVGPPPAAIGLMGSKVEAKRIMAAAGVPVLAELDPATVTEDELPVLVKASAGGGGRGMRVVRELGELAGAVESARAEAASAFGDPAVFCERYLETGRHIEVQVLADTHGTVWAVGERECSIQRRHQKVVEEAPSPLVDDRMRAELFDAARKAAQAIDYVGAGTAEFLATNDGKFFFLEMNTRLQVEHPVTELVSGLDLVALQIRIAEGHRLPADPPQWTGHAIEVRLYAEDPAADWQPQTGTLRRFAVPGDVRVDSGVADGSVIGVHYDPMLAKVIAWAPGRAEAARKLAAALEAAEIHGVRTNRDLLVNVLRHPEFLAGNIDTAFFGRHGLATLAAPLGDERLAAVAAAFADAAANRAGSRFPGGWRNVPSAPQRKRYTAGEREHTVEYRDGKVEGEDITLVSATPDRVVLDVSGIRRGFDVARYPGLVCVGPVALTPVPRFTEPGATLAAGSLVAPMPGTVLRVAVAAGDTVAAGDPLLWLEAMKMEHRISAPADGVVAELPVAVGRQVEVGAVLAVVSPKEEQ
ncbi:ATP-grasp domain-containing protein [Amycolatopsis acidiphila]|uniref:ATP-grasp domain-containing protein n=1 Tax=Amycolatopsis acidiphila TaxID=715473 RepID=A0A558A1D7_9PSEU|nr:biotin carboxylase N-terminal domain-containing protein [Amycolatopsis acidiphila]TVT18064.1 ATP-grasp domain-containing protein [Amycolatopsis acidiphila]UIJ56634.1 ATP-grasp domain-containing protein [Amycolatopsis acidiphila]GHG56102.1 acetyl/propionyl-CoA carboxylase subuit alpha [Amycolatopsis acidiphila]